MKSGVEDCLLLRTSFSLDMCILSTVLRSIVLEWPMIVKLDDFIVLLLLIVWSLVV